MCREKIKVIENTHPEEHFTEDEAKLALDYQYDRRELHGFEKKKAQRASDKMDRIWDNFERMELF